MTGEHTSVIYGTHYPNRLFVGCLPPEAGAEDLGEFFSEYGNVVEAKVVLDNEGRSKRFGFVTFSNSDNVAELIKSRAIVFQGKMINVGPAVKKNLDTDLRAKAQPKVPKTCVGPQHTPKTVIRRSPIEPGFFPEFGGGGQYMKQPEDTSFRSLWGISSKRNSVWSGPGEARSSSNVSVASSQNSDDLSDDQNKSTCSSQNSPFVSSLSNLASTGAFFNVPAPTSSSLRYTRHQQNAVQRPVRQIYPPPGLFNNCATGHYRKYSGQ